MVKRVKKHSALSIYLKRNYTIYKCALESERLTILLVTHYNIIMRHQYFPARQKKTLDTTLEKGKKPTIENLRTIQLIEADLQILMRILVNQRNKCKIEKDLKVAKCNYRLRLQYLVEDAILEKRLVYNNSFLNMKHIIYNITDLKSYCDRQFLEIGSIV